MVFGDLDYDLTDAFNFINRLSNRGQMAFFGRLAGAGVTAANNEGIWAQDPGGTLRLIVRSGEMLDVDDGPGVDLRTVKSIGVFDFPGVTTAIQRGLQFNDRGQVEFEALFTDGSSGIFVSDAVAVPEPAAATLVACLILGFALDRGAGRLLSVTAVERASR